MKEKLKYSVIIPVYNAEKTIRRCVDSLLAEGYPDAEIILVNDGSRDRSGEICREYASKASNIRCLEKENGGVSTARNAGLDTATGEFVLFVDSDDYVVPNYFSIIDSVSAETPADLIQFSNRIYDGKQIRSNQYQPCSAYGREALMPILSDAICRKRINAPSSKLYRRDLIERYHIRFPVGVSVAEDRVFNIAYSMYIHSYVVADPAVYIISTENQNSLTRGRHDNLNQQFDIADRYFADALAAAAISEKEKDAYRRAVNFGNCRSIYHEAKLLLQDHVGWCARQKQLGRLCDKINRKHLKYPRTPYCTSITLPVRLRMTCVIDAVAWKLNR